MKGLKAQQREGVRMEWQVPAHHSGRMIAGSMAQLS